MKLGPRYKIAKRLGASIFEKTQTRAFMLSKERSAASKKFRRAGSDYSRQLIEKQKLRLTYSLTERQFSSYVKKALASKANPQAVLYTFLESRLDSVIYRMGLASTRRAARQIVSHGHVLVNRKRITIPSFQVSKDDVISIREGSKDSGLFALLPEKLKEHRAPSWVFFDLVKNEGSFTGTPSLADGETADIGIVFEFYTR